MRWTFSLVFPFVGLVAIKTILETIRFGRASVLENIYRVICRKSKLTVISRYCLNVKIEIPRTACASYPESRWRGPSFAIESSCRASSSAENEGVFPFELLGTSPCPACVYLLRFPELRDRDADGTVREERRDIFWREFAHAFAIWDGRLAKLYEARRSFRYWYDRSKWFPLRYSRETALLSEERQHFFSKSERTAVIV